jgi:VWFA-related protein
VRAIFLILAAGILVGSAVTPSAQEAQRPRTFRAFTRLIPVTVVVQDDRRRPVEGLTADDFQVFEDGKELPIAFFRARAQDPAPTIPAEIAAAASSPTGTFTNRITGPADSGGVAIVFDQLNTTHFDEIVARAHLLEFLTTLRPGDRVALYALTSDGLKIIYDFTRGAESLVNAARRVRSGESSALAGTTLPPVLDQELSAFGREVTRGNSAFTARIRTENTLRAMEDLAAHLAPVPGRKNVVWISGGFPFTIGKTKMTRETQRATNALNTADAAVYPIDPRGLIVGENHPTLNIGGPTGGLASLHKLQVILEGVWQVADWTGGRAFYSSNDIAGEMSRAVADSRLSYELGYYPVDQHWDGRFRKIEVTVRRPGVEVRHRGGYYATAPAAPETATREQAMSAALASPIEAQDLPLNVHTRRDGEKIVLELELEPGSVSFTEADGIWKGELDIAIAQTAGNRRYPPDTDVSVPLALSDQARQRLQAQGLRLSRTITLRDDAQQVRVVVRDATSGTIGSVFIDAERLRAAPVRTPAVLAAGGA